MEHEEYDNLDVLCESFYKPINFERFEANLFLGARLIFLSGRKLELSSDIIEAACIAMHKYGSDSKSSDYDVYVVASSSLLVAAKLKHTPLDIEVITSACYETYQNMPIPPGRIDLFLKIRKSVRRMEIKIEKLSKLYMEDIMYNRKGKLFEYYTMIKDKVAPDQWDLKPVLQDAVDFLTDYHHEVLILVYHPTHVAMACLFLSMEFNGLPQTDASSGTPWYTQIDEGVTLELMWEIANSVVDIYSQADSYRV